jgi:predicted porin
MKRKLFAAAVASACAMPALAQTPQIPDGLQIYGRVNMTAERITTDNSATRPNNSNYELVDNSSRVGLRYKKELVPGNYAIFQIESRTKLDDSAGSFFSSRDSFAGLQGDSWGTIRLGRTIGPVYYATYDYISMHNHDTGTSSDALLAGTVVGNQGFMNNTIWYTSPRFGGFTIDFAFSLLGESRLDPSVDQPRHIGLVGAYDAGALHLALSYANTKNDSDLDGVTGAPVTPSDATAWTFGGAYDFKFMVLGALWEKAERDTLGGSVDSDYWRIALMFPFGQHELHFNYGIVDADGDTGAQQYTLAYNYNMTKQTKVYAFYTVVDNDNNGSFGFTTSTTAPSVGAKQSSFAIGVRHNF